MFLLKVWVIPNNLWAPSHVQKIGKENPTYNWTTLTTTYFFRHQLLAIYIPKVIPVNRSIMECAGAQRGLSIHFWRAFRLGRRNEKKNRVTHYFLSPFSYLFLIFLVDSKEILLYTCTFKPKANLKFSDLISTFLTYFLDKTIYFNY